DARLLLSVSPGSPVENSDTVAANVAVMSEESALQPSGPNGFDVLAVNDVAGDAALASLFKEAPPLPDPTNHVVRVSTEAELQDAVRNLESNTTILIERGTYVLTRDLFLPRGIRNVTIRGATQNRDDVVLVGGGMERPVAGRAQTGIHIRESDRVMIA